MNFKSDNTALALLGQSGSGKSMTLKCIAGVEKPDSGRIVLDGKILYDSEKGICLPPQKREIGLLFQNYALFPTMTVIQNVMSACHRLPKKERKNHALGYIQKFGLSGFENEYPARLSGGQQQRAALARMLAANPKVLLFDEPFSALDTHLRKQLSQMVLEVLENHKGLAIVVSHDSLEAFRLCPKIAVVENGRISVYKDRESLFNAPETVCAARLIGCENILPIEMFYKPDQITDKNIKAAGIRASNIKLCENGRFRGKITRIIKSPYETTLVINMNGTDILCNLSKDSPLPDLHSNTSFSFDEKDVLFLKEDKKSSHLTGEIEV